MPKTTTLDLLRNKQDGRKTVVVTAYDWSTARLLDRAGVDALLVGDSLGMVVQGHESTLPVKLEHMIYHTQCVTRARPQALVVADMPFGSFQRGPEHALDAAIQLVQEAGAEGVKIEGGGTRLATIDAVAAADIPVWGHLGLTPQSVHAFGGYRVQGKDTAEARRLLDQARKVEAAGASAIVLECIPYDLAQEITETLSIPTIGIGAGPHCDGQVLVSQDLLGFFDDFVPKFVRQYAQMHEAIPAAVARFVEDVREGRFPTLDESYGTTRDGIKRAGGR